MFLLTHPSRSGASGAGFRRAAGWYRLLSFVAMAAAICLGIPAPAAADVSRFDCRGAILGAGKTGDERLEHFGDGHGHDVELWCVRGIFAAHFDLRIVWNEQPGAMRRERSIAGCFFNHGYNTGPELSVDAQGAYSKVEWTNRSPPARDVTYNFVYDYSSDKVTITVSAPCRPSISKIVAPQENIERLEDLLPDPPAGSCPSTAPADSLPSGRLAAPIAG